jgi:hypothetical protein
MYVDGDVDSDCDDNDNSDTKIMMTPMILVIPVF